MSHTSESLQPVAQLLLDWQTTGDERKLETLFETIAPLAEHVARHALRSAGIADPGAIDDAMSKVFDHLRRLPGPRAAERGVAVFRPAWAEESTHDDECRGESSRPGDAGIAYVRWLAKERARDVARATLRRARHTRLFSQLDAGDAGIVRGIAADDPAADDGSNDLVRQAVGLLAGRSRLVMDLLLEGESQASIARRMGVCEGTVSRIRARAIEAMRSAIGSLGDTGRARRPPK